MARKAVIGVTGNHRRWAPSWWCSRLLLRGLGTDPRRISIDHPLENEEPDALVIGGGNDISPEHYGGQLTEKVRYDPERDTLEIRWIKYALDADIPLLGICRGAQLINVVMGGTLHEDVRPIRLKTYNRPGLLPTKQVFLKQGSNLSDICSKPKLRVNSLHHQAIKDAGSGLQIVGEDLDRLCQAIESTEGRSILGVQWHPEYLFYLPTQIALFRWLVNQIDSTALQTA